MRSGTSARGQYVRLTNLRGWAVAWARALLAVISRAESIYVTNPDAGTLWQVNAASGRVEGVVAAGAEPCSVTITPNGSSVYVADENSNSVDVISTSTGRVTGSIAVQGLSMSIAATPDGSQVWVGNGYTGSISVISTATNTVTDTISHGTVRDAAANGPVVPRQATMVSVGPGSNGVRVPAASSAWRRWTSSTIS